MVRRRERAVSNHEARPVASSFETRAQARSSGWGDRAACDAAGSVSHWII